MDEVLAVRDHLYERSGIYLPAGRRYLFESQFLSRMESTRLSSLAEYLLYLKKQPHAGELSNLLNELNLGALSFFADPVRFKALSAVFIPEIVRRSEGATKELIIWLAGCGTGEEAYAAAMVLHQLQSTLLKGWRCLVWGTDRSNAAVAKAKEGLYEQFNVRGLPQELKEQYLARAQQGLMVAPELRSLTRFDQFDLAQLPSAGPRNKISIIFCCGELAHFDPQSRAPLVSLLYEALQEGGYLVLANLESLQGLRNGFRLVHYPGGFAYRKQLKGG
ncbi:MAG: hypothetical protein ONB30_10385 [candidate division KSB1 bacterium]|nr:hypothetical protein [candidate division KSB1 bacterium]